MGDDGVVAGKEELQVLFNLFDDEMVLSYPAYSDFEILRARSEDGGYEIDLGADEEDYREKQDIFQGYSGESPSYHDLRDCLLASGVITHGYPEGFEQRVNRMLNSGNKKVIFSPDTNLLYQRFLSSFDGIGPENVGIVETVRGEVENKVNSKYDHKDIKFLRMFCEGDEDLFDELRNRKKMDSRKASYLARVERREYSDRTIPAVEDHSYDSEENDRIIARSLRELEREDPVRTVMLTADDQMRDVCGLNDVDCEYLQYPHDFEVDGCSYDEFVELVGNIALVFGFVKLNSVVIFGEFGGKPDPESLKLKFLDDDLGGEFEKHLEVCRELSDLGIEK